MSIYFDFIRPLNLYRVDFKRQKHNTNVLLNTVNSVFYPEFNSEYNFKRISKSIFWVSRVCISLAIK